MAEPGDTADHIENERLVLAVLTSVENNRQITQRSLASELGIALGLANSYMKRCIQKGLIKISQVPRRRYRYYLTPRGFAEKSRLTAEYLRISFDFYRSARAELSELFDACANNGHLRVALVGAGELGEIALLCAAQHDISVIGFIDADRPDRSLHDLPIVRSPKHFSDVDAFVVTDLSRPQSTFDWLTRQVPHDCVLAPRLLNISVQRPSEAR